MHSPINIALNEESGVVGSPITTGPSQTLSQELRVGLEGSLEHALLVILNVRLPVVIDQPPRDEVVIIGIEVEFAPFLVADAIKEERISEDAGTKSVGAAGHAGRSTIVEVGC